MLSHAQQVGKADYCHLAAHLTQDCRRIALIGKSQNTAFAKEVKTFDVGRCPLATVCIASHLVLLRPGMSGNVCSNITYAC